MNEHEWVCKNCYAQNTGSDPTCRVCGLDAPPGAYREGGAASQPIELATSNVLIPRMRGYALLGLIWAALIAMLVTLLLTGKPIWLAFNGFTIRFVTSRMAQVPDQLLGIFKEINFRAFIEGISRFGTELKKTVDWVSQLSAYSPSACSVRFFGTSDGLTLLLCVTWTLRLFLRCLIGVGRPARRYRHTFPMLATEAVILNLIYYAIIICCNNMSMAARYGKDMLTKMFVLQTTGIAFTLLGLMLTDSLSRDTWRSGSGSVTYRPRMFRRDIILGLTALAVFFALSCVFLAG